MRVRETPSVTPGGVLVLANDTPLGTNRVAVTPADQPTNRIKSTASSPINSGTQQPEAMFLYWLVYRHSNQTSVVIEPGASLIHARKPRCSAAIALGRKTRSGHVTPSP